MRALLDTSVLLWSARDPSKLSPAASRVLLDPHSELFVSHVTLWELAIKASVGKLRLTMATDAFFAQGTMRLQARELAIRPQHIFESEGLPWHHRDPFDRLLVGVARADNLVVLTPDADLARYPVPTLW